jgi:hypothetical protein
MITVITGKRTPGKTTDLKKMLKGKEKNDVLIVTPTPKEWENYPFVCTDILREVTPDMASYTTLVIDDCQSIMCKKRRDMVNSCIGDPNITVFITTQTQLEWLNLNHQTVHKLVA